MNQKNQGFSKYEADYPALRADWWSTRAHRGPADFVPTEWREFVGSISAFELARDRATLFDIVPAIERLGNAVTQAKLTEVTKAKKLLQLAVGTLQFHDNFLKALDNLKTMIEGTPQYQVEFHARGLHIPQAYRELIF